MARLSSHIHPLIEHLTLAGSAHPNEAVQRRVRYALALLQASAESLDELEPALHTERRTASAPAGR